jgi:gamma-glutamylcyclotransferase (GGCT)/AIG2-like uncharacterized protein YtfP
MLAKLFVYGTLRRGSRNQFARLLAEQARFLGTARTAGRLYNLGRYPGAKPSEGPGEWVRGEVFRLDQPAKTLAALDAYEGPRFERTIARVQVVSGVQLDAWAYFYRGKPAGPRIVSGFWPRRRS